MVKAYNCIVVFNKNKDASLFCLRKNDPYKGLYNFVGGKVEPGESSEDAAYRELEEETGLTRRDIRLYRLMDIRYYHQGFILEIYVGMLEEDVDLKEEKNPLVWMPMTEDFTDKQRFAGDQNIAHIMNVALKYPIPQRSFIQDGLYIGVDGCKNGWIAAILDYGTLKMERFATVQEITEKYPEFDAFLIDMVIGLRDNITQSRPDEAAKKELGIKASTVFPVPSRSAVYAKTEEEQKKANIKTIGKSLPKQSIAIIPKIRELDTFLRDHPDYQGRILESHPEVDFKRLNGAVITTRKKEHTGFMERKNVLSHYLSRECMSDFYIMAKGLSCKPDDLMDAACLAVTAAFHAHGLSETIPEKPDRDSKGFEMKLTVPKNSKG